MDLIMKNLKNGLKKNCKIVLIICLLLVSFCIYKKSENITLFEKITNQYELNKIENKTDIKTFYFYKNDCNICKKYKKNINKLVKYIENNPRSTEDEKQYIKSLLSQAEKHAEAKCFSRSSKGNVVRQKWCLDQLQLIQNEIRQIFQIHLSPKVGCFRPRRTLKV